MFGKFLLTHIFSSFFRINILDKIYIISLFIKKIVSFVFIPKQSYLFCIPITFNNPLKACFSNKKYLITVKTGQAQIVIVHISLIEKPVFNGFLKIIGAQNQLHVTFCSDLFCNKTLKFFFILRWS